MHQSTGTERTAWVALALSLATPGLGQLYCGRPGKALLLMVASTLVFPVWIAAAYVPPTTALLVPLMTLMAGVVAVYIYALVDAYREARRQGADYRLNRYNRTSVYAMFFALGWILPAGVTYSVNEHGFKAFYIPSRSMYPNLLPGDFLLANMRIFRDRAPQLGDVVVFRDPTDAERRLVKRVIAGPGATVEIRNDHVYVDGLPLGYGEGVSATEAADSTGRHERRGDVDYPILVNGSLPGEDVAEVLVDEDHYFLLGDNRLRSRDSRNFGPVARTDIIGAVHYIYLPGDLSWSRFGVFARSGYGK